MDFLISQTHIDPIYLVITGFVIGIFGGFFGVGGSFLAGPALFAVGVPMNFVVGTDLAHIVGKSIVAAKKHRALGNVDLKLGTIMVIGTIVGVEVGAQGIESLKHLGAANVDRVIGITFVVVLISISAFVAWESWQTIKMQRDRKREAEMSGIGVKKLEAKEDESAFDHVARKVHRINIPPMIKLRASGVERVSLWAILLVAFVGGIFSGFLGGGAGYIRMPSMVYLLGVPTHVAVGTDLFEVVISASYGTLTHAIKGNVDIMIALVMHTGAAIGAQIGAASTEYFHGPKIRLAFVPLPLIGAAIVIYGLLSGHHVK
ncbi:MAG TPA: sulfite exporter TauE/SafE family protein [Blastocatellia bacterium]|nr:sulfite exporter TauE/SafE family protein [Blastocatellia bacterium]